MTSTRPFCRRQTGNQTKNPKPLKLLQLQLPSPAEKLAADEAVLDLCEAGDGDETLLFWEPRETFVVVGYANKVATEVNVTACEAKGIPIFRRCSGGGTVVQMRGGLNYSLILRIEENTPTRNISSANEFIMERNRAAVESCFLACWRSWSAPEVLLTAGPG